MSSNLEVLIRDLYEQQNRTPRESNATITNFSVISKVLTITESVTSTVKQPLVWGEEQSIALGLSLGYWDGDGGWNV